jgi:hypothetical protein
VRQFLGLGQKKLWRPSQKYFASESPCRYRAALYGQCRGLGGARGVPPSLRAPLELLTLRAKSRHKPRFGALNGRRPMRQDTPLKMHVQCSSSPHHSLEPVTWRSNPSFPASNGLYLPPHGLFQDRSEIRPSWSNLALRSTRPARSPPVAIHPPGCTEKKEKEKRKKKKKRGGVRRQGVRAYMSSNQSLYFRHTHLSDFY